MALLAGGPGRAQDGYIFTTFSSNATNYTFADFGAPGPHVQHHRPRGITLDGSENIYISSETAFPLFVYNRTGLGIGYSHAPWSEYWGRSRYNLLIEAKLPGAGGLTSIAVFLGGIVANPNGGILLADTGNSSVQAYPGRVEATLFAGAPLPARFDATTGIYTALAIGTSADGYGTAARFISPFGIACDRDGAIYVTDTNANTIRKIVGQEVSTYAGSAGSRGSANGPRLDARFNGPTGIAVDGSGNVYVVDSNNFAIRRISSDGTVTTLAGAIGSPGSADGQGSAATFGGQIPDDHRVLPLPVAVAYGPLGIAVDDNGTVFVADTINHTLRRITPNGVVTTIGGQPGRRALEDGVGTAARFAFPQGIALDRAGNLYIADTYNNRVRKGTPAYAPTIRTQPQGRTVDRGQNVELTVSATSALPFTYQWAKNSTAILGATGATLTLANIQPADAGDYSVSVSNGVGSTRSLVAAIGVNVPPSIVTSLRAQAVIAGQSLMLSITATGTPAPVYQWQKAGTNIPGATNATFTLPAAKPEDAGFYRVVITNSAGTTSSAEVSVTVTVPEPPKSSRIVNLSIRSALSPAVSTLTVGFVVAGNGKTLLVRAIGPALAQFGVTGALSDPRLTLFSGSAIQTSNDNWSATSNADAVEVTASQVGAFPLPRNSMDAAALSTFDAGGYSAQIAGPVNGNGIVLVELYDGNPAADSKLINVSTRTRVGTGENMLVAGFVISGNAPKKLLIRAAGPALAAFGVVGALTDPRLEISRGGVTPLAVNDDWGGTPELIAEFAARGAFPFPSPASRDAALLITLEPGNYTAQVSGAGATEGEALVEIYEVP